MDAKVSQLYVYGLVCPILLYLRVNRVKRRRVVALSCIRPLLV